MIRPKLGSIIKINHISEEIICLYHGRERGYVERLNGVSGRLENIRYSNNWIPCITCIDLKNKIGDIYITSDLPNYPYIFPTEDWEMIDNSPTVISIKLPVNSGNKDILKLISNKVIQYPRVLSGSVNLDQFLQGR